jgi:hypothetical protein
LKTPCCNQETFLEFVVRAWGKVSHVHLSWTCLRVNPHLGPSRDWPWKMLQSLRMIYRVVKG